ncbi:ABC transporter permease [Streptomyces sp. 184]|uniref:ABC transporter permease n=1 Tax=Streptomyces sp. 184 TaxID=1827526 RepID=UPI00389137E6
MSTQSRSMVVAMVMVPLAITLALWAFIWPNARLEPRDLPIGIAAPADAAAGIEKQLSAREGAFDLHIYPDEQAARTAIEEREVYGAVVSGPEGPKLLTASAASPTVAQLLATTATASGASAEEPMPVEDVVPSPAADPRGSALNSSILPLAIAGLALGAVVPLLGMRGTPAIGAVLAAATLIGVTAGLITDTWLDILTGNWWAQAGVFALIVLAGGAVVAGLGALRGHSGIALGALLVVIFGNPFAGITSAPELLPEPVGMIGQWLPPGAGGTLLRSVSFFDGHGATAALITLIIWAVVGLSLLWLDDFRRSRRDIREFEALRPSAEAA